MSKLSSSGTVTTGMSRNVIYSLPNEETLGIEVATAYYEDSDAKQEWTLARGDRPHPPDGVELRLGGPIKEPDKLMCERVQRELVDKCHRRYSGVVNVSAMHQTPCSPRRPRNGRRVHRLAHSADRARL